MLLPPPLMTSPFYPRCGHIPIYLRLFYAPLLPLIYRPFFLSAHHLFFVARTVYEPHIYRLIRPPARPFVYLAITIVDRYDVGYTPQGGNTRGCNRFAEFPNENCDPQPHRLRRHVALVLVGLDTAKFHGGYRSSNFIVK